MAIIENSKMDLINDQQIITINEKQLADITTSLAKLFAIPDLRPFPDDYEKVKDKYLDFMETAFIVDEKFKVPVIEIVKNTNKGTDDFAKYLLSNK